jgi:hypothetical protein
VDAVEEHRRFTTNYEPSVLSDRWTFSRGEVANLFFNRSYQWLAKIEAKGFEMPEGIEYAPQWSDSGNRVYHLKDIDALATCLAWNKIIDGEKALRVFNLLYAFSVHWSGK